MRDNAVVRTKEIKFAHMIEALKEPRFYCFFFTSLLVNFQNGAMNTFSSIITKGFGFSVSKKSPRRQQRCSVKDNFLLNFKYRA